MDVHFARSVRYVHSGGMADETLKIDIKNMFFAFQTLQLR